MSKQPDLALITNHSGFLGRAVCQYEPQQWQLRDCRVIMLPLRCKQGQKALQSGMTTAYRAGCRLAALPPWQRRAIAAASLQVADGRLLALSYLTRRLDIDCPGWRRDAICLNADNNFSCLTARWLAPYCTHLHICGQDKARRQALAQLLFRENGLIAATSPLPPPNTLFLPPPDFETSPALNGIFAWQNWPCQASNGKEELISCHLAEGLLLTAGGLPPGIKPLQLLRLLQHRSIFYQIVPI